MGHGCCPILELETVGAIIKAAPTTLLGFIDSETEQQDVLEYYIVHYMRPVMDLCRTRPGVWFLPREKNTWWASQAARPEIHRLLFSGEYRSVLVRWWRTAIRARWT